MAQIAAPRQQLRGSIVTALVGGAFVVGLAAGVGGLRTVEAMGRPAAGGGSTTQVHPIAGRDPSGFTPATDPMAQANSIGKSGVGVSKSFTPATGGQAHDLIVNGSNGGGIRYTGIPYPAPERQP